MTITTTQSFNTRALPTAGSLMRALDTVNFFVAASLAGFGPFVAVFLGEQNWSQEEIGFLLSAGAAAGPFGSGARGRTSRCGSLETFPSRLGHCHGRP
jgi:hypothetical protein